MEFLEFLEKSWNVTDNWEGSWESHGIFKLEQKVIEFDTQVHLNKSVLLRSNFSMPK